MINAAIIGGSAYTAGELLRLLINHPDVEIQWVHAPEKAGELIADIHQGLLGETYLRFTSDTRWDDVDVLFSCLPHGQIRPFIAENTLPEGIKIIDLSRDFRLKSDDEHDFVYGLPELNRKPMVRGALHVSNPGAIATAVELSLLPLAEAGLLKNDIHITAIAGSTFEDVNTLPQTNYSMRNGNITLYKPFQHQQLGEIRSFVSDLQKDFDREILMITMRGCFTRGVLTATYMTVDPGTDLEEIRQLFEEAYADHSFTFISDRYPDLKDVVNTNKCIIHLDKIGNRLLITTVLDNLLKGGAGTALHNMNLLFGLSERTGLTLKPSAF